VHHSRPKNLNLLTIKFPLPAIVSILHRITGVALFLLIPFFLWVFQRSLTADGYEALQYWLTQTYCKWLLWLLFIPLCFHLVAGIRHLLSDLHIGASLKQGRRTAALTFLITAVIMIGMGVWLW
jgi:succinate dehydrogenase / fumarate reductase, cytochrome b subunit